MYPIQCGPAFQELVRIRVLGSKKIIDTEDLNTTFCSLILESFEEVWNRSVNESPTVSMDNSGKW
jgi:hypothetical protein